MGRLKTARIIIGYDPTGKVLLLAPIGSYPIEWQANAGSKHL